MSEASHVFDPQLLTPIINELRTGLPFQDRFHDLDMTLVAIQLIPLLRDEFKKGLLILPSHLRHITSHTLFNSRTSQFYQKPWVIHLKGQSNNMKANVDYLGKYLKRPPIGETRIKDYDGTSVTYEYLDHSTKTQEIMTLPILEFIARLIRHIPDFRNIRYYGFLSHKLRGKLLPLLVRCTYCSYEFHLLPREARLLETKNARDPLCPIKEECDICHSGFMIPVNYTDKQGKVYLFHELKPKMKNLDPNNRYKPYV